MAMPTALLKSIATAAVKSCSGRFSIETLLTTFPDFATKAWLGWSRERREDQRRTEVEQVAQAETNALQAAILEVVGSISPRLPDKARHFLTAYLIQVQASLRGFLRRPSDPQGTIVPSGLVINDAEGFSRLLPLSLPRFTPGDRPISSLDRQLVELLGSGGFGEVWKATNPNFPAADPCALKFCLDSTAARLLRHEGAVLNQIMRQSKHSGIVQLKDTHLNADPPCLEYELIHGSDLIGLMRDWQWHKYKITPGDTVAVILDITRTVAFAHTLIPPIVHRDLKPSNILVECGHDGQCHFKIADFGIAGLAAAGTGSQRVTNRQEILSTEMRGVGTRLYASPQQIRGHRPDPRDDVFSLGVIWYQLLTGDLSAGRPGGTRWQSRLKDRGVPPSTRDLLSACLEEEPEDRPADGAKLVDQLERLNQIGLGSVPLVTRTRKAQERREEVKPQPQIRAEAVEIPRKPSEQNVVSALDKPKAYRVEEKGSVHASAKSTSWLRTTVGHVLTSFTPPNLWHEFFYKLMFVFFFLGSIYVLWDDYDFLAVAKSTNGWLTSEPKSVQTGSSVSKHTEIAFSYSFEVNGSEYHGHASLSPDKAPSEIKSRMYAFPIGNESTRLAMKALTGKDVPVVSPPRLAITVFFDKNNPSRNHASLPEPFYGWFGLAFGLGGIILFSLRGPSSKT